MSRLRSTQRVVGALLAAVVVATSTPVEAASPSVVGVTCTATANFPTINTRRQISGSASVTCTNSGRSSQYLTVRVTVYEYVSKGVAYNYMGYAYSTVKSYTLKPGAKATWSLATAARLCADQEPGNDDYGSEVVVNPVAPIAVATRHRIDGYAC